MRCLPVLLVPVFIFQAAAWAGARQDFGALRAAAAQYVSGQVHAAYTEASAEVEVGAIDPRLNLPDCPEPAFALTSGNRLWGSGTLRVSCTAPAPWSLYLSYRVILKGPALIAKRPLLSGYSPGPGDVTKGVVEYAGDPGRYLRDAANLQGSVLSKPLARSSPITIDVVHMKAIIKPGQPVNVLFNGQGFQVSQEGIAQSQASPGDTLRVKTPSGSYVQGVVQPDGTVRVYP